MLAVEQQEGQAVVAQVERHELLKAGENVIVRDVEQQQVFQPREDLAKLSDPFLPKVQGPQGPGGYCTGSGPGRGPGKGPRQCPSVCCDPGRVSLGSGSASVSRVLSSEAG